MRKLFIFLAIVVVLAGAGYLYVRYSVLKTKEIKPDQTKAVSVLDLRPSIIAKLQELVKKGSDGLYNLSVDKLQPHVIISQLDVQNAILSPDTAALAQLDKAHKAPDDVFKISFRSLHIDGIGIDDLLHKDEIDLKSVYITDPVIEVYHTKRPYNKEIRKRNDTATLYHRLTKQMKKISIDKILVTNATFINHNLSKNVKAVTKYNDVSLSLNDLLVDSSTQFDGNRFLFAKHAGLSLKNYSLPTADSLYFIKAASINISGESHSLTATNVALVPRGDKKQFQKRLSTMKERYDVRIPRLTLTDVNWWQLANRESFIAKKGEILDARWNVYLDRTMPPPKVKMDNFPHQLLMRLPVPVSVTKMDIRNCDISYEEFEPKIFKSGTIYIDKINAQIANFTNIPKEMQQGRFTTLKGSGLFMHRVPMNATFKLDLLKYKKGNFSAGIHMDGGLDSTILNPFAETMGLFLVKKGVMKEGTAHVEGDNLNVKGKVLLLYNDLHITPLKSQEKKDGSLKKKTLTGIIANTFLIKNDNPAKNKEPRSPDFTLERDHHTDFFNFIWKGVLTGIMKTIGVPPKFAVK